MWTFVFLTAALVGRRRWGVALALFAVSWAVYDRWAAQQVVHEGSVVITGASTGIGRNASFYFAQNGFHVFPTFRKGVDKDSLVQEAKARGVEKFVHPVSVDVKSVEAIEGMKSQVLSIIAEKRLPPLVGVILNAGVGGGSYPIEYTDDYTLRHVFDVNFFGLTRVAHSFIPELRKTKGRFVSVSSLKGSIPVPGSASYCASKAAVNSFTTALNREMYHFGVRAIVFEPGYIQTNISANSADNNLEKETKLAESDAGVLYPGFRRASRELASRAGTLSRGIGPEKTSRDLFQTVTCRFPAQIVRSGGPEVFSVNWLPTIIPEPIMEWFASSFMFKYGLSEEDAQNDPFAKLKKIVGA